RAGCEQSFLQNLFAAEILKFQIELGRINQRVHRGESYDLARHDLDPVSFREQLDEFFGFEELALMIIGHVHRDLDDSTFFQLEAQRLDVGETTVLRPKLVRNLLRDREIVCPKVNVVGDQYFPRTHRGGSCSWVNLVGAKVRLLGRVSAYFVAESFEFARSNICKVSPLGHRSSFLIEEDWNMKSLCEFSPEIIR